MLSPRHDAMLTLGKLGAVAGPRRERHPGSDVRQRAPGVAECPGLG